MSVLFSSADPCAGSEILDAHHKSRRAFRVGLLITAVAILNLIDLMYTVFADGVDRATHLEMFHEMNPLAAVFLQLGLLRSLICFKILMVGCGLGLLWKVRQSRWAVPACWILLAAYVLLGGMWWAWVSDLNQTMEFRLVAAP